MSDHSPPGRACTTVQPDPVLTRRGFLRVAALGAIGATVPGCRPATRNAPTPRRPSSGRDRRLRILQWSHTVPAYDQWFNDVYVKRWGESNDVEVQVDHISLTELVNVASAEVAAQRGHDLFGFLASPSVFEDHVIDHATSLPRWRASSVRSPLWCAEASTTRTEALTEAAEFEGVQYAA